MKTDREGPVRQFWGPATRVAQPACTAPSRVSSSTDRRDFTADSLQMLRGRSPVQSVIALRPIGRGHRGCTEIGLSRLDGRPIKKYRSALS
jgi:hypothetical protein